MPANLNQQGAPELRLARDEPRGGEKKKKKDEGEEEENKENKL